jgi:hypothetical protein
MRADSDLPALAIFTKVRSAEKAYDLGAERGPHPLDPTVHGDKAHGFEHPHSRDHGAPAHPGKCRQGVIARRQTPRARLPPTRGVALRPADRQELCANALPMQCPNRAGIWAQFATCSD